MKIFITGIVICSLLSACSATRYSERGQNYFVEGCDDHSLFRTVFEEADEKCDSSLLTPVSVSPDVIQGLLVEKAGMLPEWPELNKASREITTALVEQGCSGFTYTGYNDENYADATSRENLIGVRLVICSSSGQQLDVHEQAMVVVTDPERELRCSEIHSSQVPLGQ